MIYRFFNGSRFLLSIKISRSGKKLLLEFPLNCYSTVYLCYNVYTAWQWLHTLYFLAVQYTCYKKFCNVKTAWFELANDRMIDRSQVFPYRILISPIDLRSASINVNVFVNLSIEHTCHALSMLERNFFWQITKCACYVYVSPPCIN